MVKYKKYLFNTEDSGKRKTGEYQKKKRKMKSEKQDSRHKTTTATVNMKCKWTKYNK